MNMSLGVTRKINAGVYAIFLLVTVLVLSGCGTAMKPEDFKSYEPRLTLETFFDGQVKAWGMFEDRFGKVRRQFVVDIDGTWDGRQLVLDEHFRYADGETDRRIWTITKIDDHTYSGTADDVIGIARGKTYGNALNWAYVMNLKVGDGTWKVDFDDWMFLQPDGVLLNRATVRRWGITIGTVTLAFLRNDARQEIAGRGYMRAAAE